MEVGIEAFEGVAVRKGLSMLPPRHLSHDFAPPIT